MAVEKWIKISELPKAPYDNSSVLVTEDTVDQDQTNLTHTAEEIAEKIFDNFVYTQSRLQTTSKVPTGAVNEAIAATDRKLLTGVLEAGQTEILFTNAAITSSKYFDWYVPDFSEPAAVEVVNTNSLKMQFWPKDYDRTIKVVII